MILRAIFKKNNNYQNNLEQIVVYIYIQNEKKRPHLANVLLFNKFKIAIKKIAWEKNKETRVLRFIKILI